MKKYQVKTTSANVLQDISHKDLETELLFGEVFIGEEEIDGWVHGYCEHDEYKGWVKRDNFSRDIFTPTHIINVAQTLAYKENAIESEVSRQFAFASKINVIKEDVGTSGEKMSQLSNGEWVMSAHIAPIDNKETDITKTAMKLLNTPYHWGGRSGYSGLDCSGFTQICLDQAGVKIPRNSGAQSQSDDVGELVDTPKKGDLVYFKGHVVIMLDDKNIIHAVGDNPRGGKDGRIGMIVRTEPLDEFISSLAPERQTITAIRRPKL